MTIREAIDLTVELYEPTYSEATLTRWLWEMDQRMLQEELLRPGIIDQYDITTDENVTLLIPAPYERLYLLYLARMIHLHRSEYDEAANYESEWQQLKNEYMAHLLNDLPRTPEGKPWLDEPLTLRAGRQFEGRLFWLRQDTTAADVYLIDDGTVLSHWELETDDELEASEGILTLKLDETYTATLNAGGYQLRISVTTEEHGTIDAYPIPLRVLPAYQTT